MRTSIIYIMCFICTIVSAKKITDMAGRVVEVPENIEEIFPYDSKVSILLFPLLKDKMVATAMLPGQESYTLISSEYTAMPEVDVKNVEEILNVSPQLIIAGFYNVNGNRGSAEKLGLRLSIPVIFVDLSLDKMDETYAFLGEIFHREKESEVYVSFISKLYRKVAYLKKQQPTLHKTVYYTLGTSGLMTDPSGSKHTEVFDYMGIPNAAKIDIPSGGHAKVNMEQVLMWNPDYIFTSSFKGKSSAYTSITNNDKWKSIEAVQQHNVFQVPGAPFGWFDHPPSVNRIPGLIWMCEIFYHEPHEDTRTSITQFYKLFYHYDLTLVEYHSLFN